MPDGHLLFFLIKKVNKKIKKKSSGLYPQGPQARGHFFGPPRFALS